MTDNGACYRSRDFAAAVGGAKHRFTRPLPAQTIGKVERFTRTAPSPTNGPTPAPMTATTPAPRPIQRGCTTATTADATPRSAG